MIFFIGISVISCGSSRLNINEFEDLVLIKEIYSQEWVAGIRGGGAGINIFINLNSSIENEIVLKKIQYKTYEVPVIKVNELSYVARIDTGQNKLKASDADKGIYDEDITINKTDFNLKNKQAILFYKKGNKYFSKIIDYVEEREMITYPSMRRPTE